MVAEQPALSLTVSKGSFTGMVVCTRTELPCGTSVKSPRASGTSRQTWQVIGILSEVSARERDVAHQNVSSNAAGFCRMASIRLELKDQIHGRAKLHIALAVAKR